MNCECFYVVKENTLEAARELAEEIDRVANKQEEEVFPVCISKTKRSFHATSDYDNFKPTFNVKKDQFLVFAQGKDYCMDRIRPKGGKRGFPDHFDCWDFYDNFYEYIEDIEKVG